MKNAEIIAGLTEIKESLGIGDSPKSVINAAIQVLEERTIAEERYQDLQDYFSDPKIAKTILGDKEEFKAWLDRLRWHTKKVDELARKLQDLEERKEGKWITKGVDGYYQCPFCKAEFWDDDDEMGNWKRCPICEAKMRGDKE